MDYVTTNIKTPVIHRNGNNWDSVTYVGKGILIRAATPITINTPMGVQKVIITNDKQKAIIFKDVKEATSAFGGESIDFSGDLSEVNLGADGATGVASVTVTKTPIQKFADAFTTKNILIGVGIVLVAFGIWKHKAIISLLKSKK